MTTKFTRSISRSTNSTTTTSTNKNTKFRDRKSRMYDSNDEHVEVCTQKVPKTPKKDKLKPDEAVTPPKQKRFDKAITPEDKKIVVKNCYTPSTFIERLSLASPIRSTSQNKKSLFQETNDNLFKPMTNSEVNKSFKNNSDENCAHELDDNKDLMIFNIKEDASEIEKNTKCNFYRNARKALHSSVTTSLPGREKELSVLRNFIKENIQNSTSGSMYISGPPGTGKTASLCLILQEKYVSDIKIQFYDQNKYNYKKCLLKY